MKKYVKEVIDAIEHEENLTYHGKGNEIGCHFLYDENDKNLPVIVQCFGITLSDDEYEVYRENQNIYVLEYVVSGKGFVEIDNKKYTVGAGDVYFLEPNTKQHYYSDKKDPFKKYWVNFKSEGFRKILEALSIKNVNYFPNVDLSDSFNALFTLEAVSIFAKDVAFEALEIIFSMVSKLAKSLSKENVTVPTVIKKAKQLIDENIRTNITIDEICKQLYISKPTLTSKFKKYYGDTPNQYKIKQKIHLSSMILKDSFQSISQISNELGFSDQYTFSHCFSKIMGISPMKYRKKYATKRN